MHVFLMNSSDAKVPLLSETSDYSSGTDLELQSMQPTSSPQTDSSPFTFDFDEPSFSHSIENINNPTSSSPRRMSLSSSSSSYSSTSPCSSISNLSSLSSSSELQTNFNNQNRLSNKKISSINNNNNTINKSTDLIICHCDKENFSNRKRNRFNSYPTRRYTTLNYCENCQSKRLKYNLRAKYYSNRQQKHRFNNRNDDTSLTAPVRFSVDLTGLNVNFSVDYHDNIKCTCSTTVIANTNRCKCLSTNYWPSYFMMNSFNEYTNNDLYYVDTDNTHNSWIQQTNPIFNYPDSYFTKLNHDNNVSSIYFDDNSIIEAVEHFPSYYLRCMIPAIEIECERTKMKRKK